MEDIGKTHTKLPHSCSFGFHKKKTLGGITGTKRVKMPLQQNNRNII